MFMDNDNDYIADCSYDPFYDDGIEFDYSNNICHHDYYDDSYNYPYYEEEEYY